MCHKSELYHWIYITHDTVLNIAAAVQMINFRTTSQSIVKFKQIWDEFFDAQVNHWWLGRYVISRRKVSAFCCLCDCWRKVIFAYRRLSKQITARMPWILFIICKYWMWSLGHACLHLYCFCALFNSLQPERNGWHFADIFKSNSMKESSLQRHYIWYEHYNCDVFTHCGL